MRQKDQTMRFNDIELGIMKRVFADNEDLIFIVRKVLFQSELTKGERNMLDASLSDEVNSLLKKMFVPELDTESPLFQMTDLPLGLNLAMNSKGVEEMQPLFEAKKLEMDYLNQQLEAIKNENSSKRIRFSSMAKLEPYPKAFVGVTARNWLLVFIDSSLQQIKILAGTKKETLEETMERISKDSAK